MIRHNVPIWFVLGAFCGLLGPLPTDSCAAQGRGPRGGGRPNVLFLFTDDQRADTIHALGNPTIQTPNLDRLAESGFVFRNAYCMGGDRPAVCLPSRTMVLSGRSLFHLDELTPQSPNFPTSMRHAGYLTYHHGKRGNTPQAIQERFDRNRYLVNDDKERRSGQPGKEIADDAIAFLKSRDRNQPFFMYLAFANPHDPRTINEDDRRRYEESQMPLPRNFRPLHPFDNGDLLIRDEALAPWPRTPEAVRSHLTDYYGVISHLDQEIGRVLQTLRNTRDFDNTIIVFSSDHGLALGSHGLFGKQNLYEDGMKVPLIFRGPGISRGSSDALVYLHDIYPTVCELIGEPIPDSLDGKSLAPIVRRQTTEVRNHLLLAYRSVQRAVRDGQWKLIRYPKINTSQLFNLKDDPDETHDLADDPQFKDRLAEMTHLLEREQKAAGDTLALTSDHPKPAKVDESFFHRKKP